jgi:hypothetical protein
MPSSVSYWAGPGKVKRHQIGFAGGKGRAAVNGRLSSEGHDDRVHGGPVEEKGFGQSSDAAENGLVSN